MIQVNEKLTRYVAHLARLALSDQEVKTFTAQLGEILQYIEKLQEVEVVGIEPLYLPIELEPVLRDDQVLLAPKVLESAPDVLEDSFKVPAIL